MLLVTGSVTSPGARSRSPTSRRRRKIGAKTSRSRRRPIRTRIFPASRRRRPRPSDRGEQPATPASPPMRRQPRTPGKDKKDAAADKGKEPAKDQAYWSGRMKELQTQLDRDQTLRRRAAEQDQLADGRFHGARRSGAAGGHRARQAEGARRARPAQAGHPGRQEGDRGPRRRSAPRGRSARLAAVTVRVTAGAGPSDRAAPRLRPPAPILLVEDKDSLRTMLRHALEAQGHSVVEARDQPEAVQALQTGRPGRRAVRSAAARRATASASCARRRSSIPSCPSSS